MIIREIFPEYSEQFSNLIGKGDVYPLNIQKNTTT